MEREFETPYRNMIDKLQSDAHKTHSDISYLFKAYTVEPRIYSMVLIHNLPFIIHSANNRGATDRS